MHCFPTPPPRILSRSHRSGYSLFTALTDCERPLTFWLPPVGLNAKLWLARLLPPERHRCPIGSGLRGNSRVQAINARRLGWTPRGHPFKTQSSMNFNPLMKVSKKGIRIMISYKGSYALITGASWGLGAPTPKLSPTGAPTSSSWRGRSNRWKSWQSSSDPSIASASRRSRRISPTPG
jgi:hypothetical protein